MRYAHRARARDLRPESKIALENPFLVFWAVFGPKTPRVPLKIQGITVFVTSLHIWEVHCGKVGMAGGVPSKRDAERLTADDSAFDADATALELTYRLAVQASATPLEVTVEDYLHMLTMALRRPIPRR